MASTRWALRLCVFAKITNYRLEKSVSLSTSKKFKKKINQWKSTPVNCCIICFVKVQKNPILKKLWMPSFSIFFDRLNVLNLHFSAKQQLVRWVKSNHGCSALSLLPPPCCFSSHTSSYLPVTSLGPILCIATNAPFLLLDLWYPSRCVPVNKTMLLLPGIPPLKNIMTPLPQNSPRLKTRAALSPLTRGSKMAPIALLSVVSVFVSTDRLR